MRRTRILLADDHSLVLRGIAKLLEEKFEVVGLAENGRALVEAALRLHPEVMVLDISMPILNGIDALHEVRRQLPVIKAVILTMHNNPIYLRKALNAGASGYVLKSSAAEELLKAIETVLKGGLYITPQFGEGVLTEALAGRNEHSRSSVELTGRQRQILQLVAEGRQNKEIAEILHVSVKTIEFHRSRLMAKLNVRSVAELTAIAIREGLMDGGGLKDS